MNMRQERSLQLIDELFSRMDDEAFLREYEAIKLNIGPTIESFLAQYCFGSFVKTTSIEYGQHSFVFSETSKRGKNSLYLVNDEIYFEQLAA